MEKTQFEAIMAELEDIKALLILAASKPKATSDEIGKVLGVSGSRIRNILSGKKGRRQRMN